MVANAKVLVVLLKWPKVQSLSTSVMKGVVAKMFLKFPTAGGPRIQL